MNQVFREKPQNLVKYDIFKSSELCAMVGLGRPGQCPHGNFELLLLGDVEQRAEMVALWHTSLKNEFYKGAMTLASSFSAVPRPGKLSQGNRVALGLQPFHTELRGGSDWLELSRTTSAALWAVNTPTAGPGHHPVRVGCQSWVRAAAALNHHILHLVCALLRDLSPPSERFLQGEAGDGQPILCLSWRVTLLFSNESPPLCQAGKVPPQSHRARLRGRAGLTQPPHASAFWRECSSLLRASPLRPG